PLRRRALARARGGRRQRDRGVGHQPRARRRLARAGGGDRPAVSMTLDIRPGDRRAAWGAALALFTLHLGHGILETARDTLFLAQLPAPVLPWAGVALAGPTPLVGRFPARRQLVGILVAGAAIPPAFYPLAGRAAAIALYVWTSLFAASAMSRAWLVIAEVFSPAQAKRLYPFVGAGALLGSAAGSLA